MYIIIKSLKYGKEKFLCFSASVASISEIAT